jgi:hypothetical protein
MHFSQQGDLIGFLDMYALGMYRPRHLAVSGNGTVGMTSDEVIYYMNSALGIQTADTIPTPIQEGEEASFYGLFPSDHETFWVLYSVDRSLPDGTLEGDAYLAEFGSNGWIGNPQLLYTGEWLWDYQFVTPSGHVLSDIEDMYGFTYEIDPFEGTNVLHKYSPQEEEAYSFSLASDPGWTVFDQGYHFYVTWSGDFYTLRATDEGAVLTKYELNLAPIAIFFVVTHMPYVGPSPAAIEFDASMSHDPNEGDELTYEWDFDGDRVFSEPVDDSYTGDPANPTHNYTSDYTGPVNLRVTDNHSASSTYTWTIVVDIQ